MEGDNQERQWFWLTLALSSISIVGLVFAVWELVEGRFFRDLDYITLHYLYISRGIAASMLLAFWAAWFVLRERRQKEQELRHSREYYRDLLEAAPGAVALYDRDLRVREWNIAAERLYGYSKHELLGQRLPTVPRDDREELEQLLVRLDSGEPVLDLETQRNTKDGAILDVQLTLRPFRGTTQSNCFLEVTYDIRERVRLRRTLLEVEKLTTMGKMAAGTAHHLNTPLAAMLLRSEMMLDGVFEGSLQEDLARLQDSLRFCQHFVQRLLAFSRPPQACKQPETISSTIESVITFLKPQLLPRRVSLDLQLGPAGQERILADRNQLEALFLILLSNSLDAVASDGHIGVSCDWSANDRVELRITDDGCGIENAALPHIFEPFFTTKPVGKGTGLGLAIAANIVQEHAGEVRIESSPGKGTTARVELPVYREALAMKGQHS